MGRWKVRKRDGVWVVLDRAGKLRYAANEHHMALTFGLIAASEKRSLPPAVDVLAWERRLSRSIYFLSAADLERIKKQPDDEIMKALEQTDYEENDDEEED